MCGSLYAAGHSTAASRAHRGGGTTPPLNSLTDYLVEVLKGLFEERFTCSNACRMELYYRRKIEAHQLRGQGLTLKEIANSLHVNEFERLPAPSAEITIHVFV